MLILLAYLSLGVMIGLFGSRSSRPGIWLAAVLLAGSLPTLLWLALSIRDALVFGRPVFDRVSESGRFGFYVGGQLAIWAAPLWLLAGLGGLWIGRRNRNRNLF